MISVTGLMKLLFTILYSQEPKEITEDLRFISCACTVKMIKLCEKSYVRLKYGAGSSIQSV